MSATMTQEFESDIRGGDMKSGMAMCQTLTGIADFIGGEVCTVSPGGPGKVIGCWKCEQCGWSVTA